MKNSTFPKNSLRNNKHTYILTYFNIYVKKILKIYITVIFVKFLIFYDVKLKVQNRDII